MEILDSEKRRARNLIWNAAADYSFEPDFKAYDEDGRAALYWNSIIGAVRKNYGAETIEGLFESLHGCSKEQLFETIWGYDYVGDSATVTVHIGRIREKIEDNPSHPKIIETVWGAGYRLNR